MARANRFDQLVDAWAPELRKAFLEAIARIRSDAHLEQIVKMLDRGDVEGAIKAVGLSQEQFRTLDDELRQAFNAGGKWTEALIPAATDSDGFRTIFQFSIRNPSAEAWLRDYSSNLIREIIDDQRNAIRDFLQSGMREGLNPRTVALDLVGRINADTGRREGGIIGLTRSQEEWVRNYEAELRSDNPGMALDRNLRDRRFDRAVRAAMDKDEPIDGNLINTMVRTYRNRALRYRAEAIGRTEAMTALHQAQQEALSQAIGSGIIQKSAVTVIWRATDDDRTREAHADLDGESVHWGGVFSSELGPIRFPGDPLASAENTINCRCWLEPRVDFLAGIN